LKKSSKFARASERVWPGGTCTRAYTKCDGSTALCGGPLGVTSSRFLCCQWCGWMNIPPNPTL